MEKKLLCLILLSFLTFSCSSVHTFANKDVDRNGKIAVVIGETQFEEVHRIIANDLSDKFNSGSKLKVIPQSKVKEILGSYPMRIQGPYKIVGTDTELNYSLHDIDTLSKYAKKLNVNYLYVFWIPKVIHEKSFASPDGRKGVTQPETMVHYYIGELIEFPSRRIIAQGQVEIVYYMNLKVLGGGGPPQNIKDMSEEFSEIAVKEIIEKTDIGK